MAYWLTLPLQSSKSTFSQHFKDKFIGDAVRIGSIILFHLSKLWKAKSFILCDVRFLVRLQGKLEIDHSWEWKTELPLRALGIISEGGRWMGGRFFFFYIVASASTVSHWRAWFLLDLAWLRTTYVPYPGLGLGFGYKGLGVRFRASYGQGWVGTWPVTRLDLFFVTRSWWHRRRTADSWTGLSRAVSGAVSLVGIPSASSHRRGSSETLASELTSPGYGKTVRLRSNEKYGESAWDSMGVSLIWPQTLIH